ncbi:uncharacterized protein LOC141727073 [Zonotrichia albicollis]|uniref:uncharacterized protein LOC141727073 n=1 Tax=Zonotrichia albicollis TaxID=44394 RepID=UPI003D811762
MEEAPQEHARRGGGVPEGVPLPVPRPVPAPPPLPPGPARPTRGAAPPAAPLPGQRGSRTTPPARARGGTNRGLPPLQPRVRAPSAPAGGTAPLREGAAPAEPPFEPARAEPAAPLTAAGRGRLASCARGGRMAGTAGVCMLSMCSARGGALEGWSTLPGGKRDQPHFPKAGAPCHLLVPSKDFSQHEPFPFFIFAPSHCNPCEK